MYNFISIYGDSLLRRCAFTIDCWLILASLKTTLSFKSKITLRMTLAILFASKHVRPLDYMDKRTNVLVFSRTWLFLNLQYISCSKQWIQHDGVMMYEEYLISPLSLWYSVKCQLNRRLDENCNRLLSQIATK